MPRFRLLKQFSLAFYLAASTLLTLSTPFRDASALAQTHRVTEPSPALLASSTTNQTLRTQVTLEITQERVMALLPGQSNTAAFMLINNPTSHAHWLTSASSEAFDRVELHRSFNDQGVMKMREVAAIAVPTQSQIALEQGGYHLMLLGAKKPIKAGDSISITMYFSSKQNQSKPSALKINLPVVARTHDQTHNIDKQH